MTPRARIWAAGAVCAVACLVMLACAALVGLVAYLAFLCGARWPGLVFSSIVVGILWAIGLLCGRCREYVRSQRVRAYAMDEGDRGW